MKKALIPGIAFVIGLGFGVGVMICIYQTGPTRLFANTVQSIIAERAVYGALLHDKKYEQIDILIEDKLQNSLLSIQQLDLYWLKLDPAAKVVRGYYDATGKPIPPQTLELISSIPEGKGTDIRKLADTSMFCKKK